MVVAKHVSNIIRFLQKKGVFGPLWLGYLNYLGLFTHYIQLTASICQNLIVRTDICRTQGAEQRQCPQPIYGARHGDQLNIAQKAFSKH